MTTSEITARPSQRFEAGGYRFLPSVFQYSGGVAAETGHAIERVQLARPIALDEGLKLVEAHLLSIGRPLQSICSFELRSPGQFSDAEFEAFNRRYVQTLDRWGLMQGDTNPVARTNVCPSTDAPRSPSIHSFAYTYPEPGLTTATDFITAGGAEAPEDGDGFQDKIVRFGDTSLDGLREKLRYVRDEQGVRLRSLDVDWADAQHVSAYSRHDVGPLIYVELLRHGIGSGRLTIHDASPPVADCEFEMDAHRVTRRLTK